ncbi:MAG TPA: PepSY-like domain-containing protein [Gemmataceae bacterium]|jgi:uncharacterized membrane protein YkoI
MQRLHGWLTMTVFVGVLAGAAARADEEKEEKVPLDKVPKAALDAVKAKFKDAELVGAQKENENGKLVYEINLKHKGQTIEVTVTPDGKIVSIEKTIAAKDLPKAVAEAIESKYPKAAIKKAEEVTEGGKTNYEVLLVTADKKAVEVVLDPAGKILKEEKKEKKKD